MRRLFHIGTSKTDRFFEKIQNTLNFNKRNIIREIKSYSLQSVIELCLAEVRKKEYATPWIFYLIIKWKFISTDPRGKFDGGKLCDRKRITQWAALIWNSESKLTNLHHFLRTMLDTQVIWQKSYLHDVFFFPAFVGELREDNPVRKFLLNRYKLSLDEFKSLFLLLYIFQVSPDTVFRSSVSIGDNVHAALIEVISSLAVDWRKLAGKPLDQSKPFDDALALYLSNINLAEVTFEATESPWIEEYPIINDGSKSIFSVDTQLWLRRLTTYFYERISETMPEFSTAFGESMEEYCETLLLMRFNQERLRARLPQKTRNADFVAEDDHHFYIIEVKHKKYDSKIFSIEDAERLTSVLKNQIISGYHQVKATARNIDDCRIFRHKKKPLNKKRIGFVITERSYKIGHGSHFEALAGSGQRIEDTHIQDSDIYFVGIQEFELLLLASIENSLTLAEVAERCFSERQIFIERVDVMKYFSLQSKTAAERTKDECFDFLETILP